MKESRNGPTQVRATAIAEERRQLSAATDKVRGECEDRIAVLNLEYEHCLEERRQAEK